MILVTGSAGLVGSELVRQLLARGHSVRALYHQRKPALEAHPQLEWFQGDLLDVGSLEEAMQGVTEVYHAAALVSFHTADRNRLFKTNVEGTANVVNLALDTGVQKLGYVSSVAALGRIRTGEPINETMHWSKETSNSLYGQSKFLAELEVWRGIAEGLPAAIIHPSIILGAGDWNEGSAKLFQSVYQEFPWYSDGTTGFVDVRDVAQILIELMERNLLAERYIVSAHQASYQEVFNQIADAFGKKRPHKKVTPFLAALVWRFEAIKARFTGSRPLITKETALTALSKTVFDNRKLLRAMPDFTYRPLQQSIEDTCRAFLQQHNG
ncbi:MAG TPA: NAD-dependent epimerase/dehydratase family protein [Ferruginibacter sp.]|nr:NAD-dependent epimerase/dehydratase family protein [Ferruginibacter sp.]